MRAVVRSIAAALVCLMWLTGIATAPADLVSIGSFLNDHDWLGRVALGVVGVLVILLISGHLQRFVRSFRSREHEPTTGPTYNTIHQEGGELHQYGQVTQNVYPGRDPEEHIEHVRLNPSGGPLAPVKRTRWWKQLWRRS